MQTDPSSDGAWISWGEKVTKLTSGRGPSVVIPVRRQLRFDSRTINLSQSMFSKRPDIRGVAKLDLNAKLDNRQMQCVEACADDVLAIVSMEGQLTGDEALVVLFPRLDQKEAQCICCEKPINILATIYHEKYKIINWITRYLPHKYDTVEKCLVPIRRAYINPDTWRKISTILPLHAWLHSDTS